MDLTDTTRLAAIINCIRPDWPQASLTTHIAKHLSHRPFRDVLIALAWVAADPDTATPARVLEHGPWWDAVAAGNNQAPATPTNSTLEGRCRCGMWTVRGENHQCAPKADPHAGAAAARAALHAARKDTP
jgi:hypothetical protein